MAYGAFAQDRGDVEAPAEERRRRFERTGIAAAGLCFLLVVAMFVNAHNRRTAGDLNSGDTQLTWYCWRAAA